MPRQARFKSESGLYHIMLRGINQQLIFKDVEDNMKFIETLKNYKIISGYKIYAYCLMGNHIHILLKAEKEGLEQIMKRIGGSYVYWYNWKYYRRGHLFQERFKSEPIFDEEHFATVLRYIHQNPGKAGLCKNLDEYKFSSYNEYINEIEINEKSGVVDADFTFEIISKDYFIEYNNESNGDECMDIKDSDFRLNDIDAKKVIQKISKCKNISEFQELEIKKRNRYLKNFKEKGLSIRQISRLTGIRKGIVGKI